MELHLVLAGSNVQDLRKSEAFLTSKGLQRITVLSQQSEVLSLLKQQSAEERRMTVVIGQVNDAAQPDDVDALELLKQSPTTPIAAMMTGQDDAVFAACVQLGALDILQAPISQQADRLHFLTAKWQHTLLKQQSSADFGADSAPDGFSLDIPHLGSPLEDSLNELLGPGSATSCGTALDPADWEQSSKDLAQSILPGVFGHACGGGLATFFDDALASCEAALMFDQPSEADASFAQPSASSNSSVSHLPNLSRAASLATCDLPSGKRKAEEYGEQSHGGSCDTSRHSDLMDDARYKKPKVEWSSELHQIFAAVVENIGVDKAVPSQVLNDMGAAGQGLTRQNIASHLQKYRSRSRTGVFNTAAIMPAANAPPPFVGRAASAPAAGAAASPAAGVPLLPASTACQQVPAMVPGMPCWAMGMGGMAPAFSLHAGGFWPAAALPLPAPSPAAPAQPSPLLVASLQEALRAPTGRLPIGLRLDAIAVLSNWSAGVRS